MRTSAEIPESKQKQNFTTANGNHISSSADCKRGLGFSTMLFYQSIYTYQC